LHIYIDETGDTGFKLNKGSSSIFSITFIIFRDPKEIEKTVDAIRRMMEREKIPKKLEWHFSKVKSPWKILFLNTISNFNFEVRSVIMNKKNITGKQLTKSKSHFYNYTCRLLLQFRSDVFKDAKIIFDKCGNKEFYTKLRKYLRKECKLDNDKIQNIKSKDSKKEIPLQIVDMVAGAIGRSFSDKKDKNDYIRIIQSKISNKFVFPDDLK
jgi:uncharacterized protein (DUF2164 family)